MKNVLVLILLPILIACVDNKRKETKKEEETNSKQKIDKNPVEKDDNLKVIVNAKVLVDDVFEVYFYELGEETFHSKDYVSSRIKGMAESQDIIFVMPKKIYPERLRLDFGRNKNQKPIELNAVKLKYNEKEYVFSPEEISSLSPSKFMECDPNNETIITKEIDGRYDPYFYTQKVNSIVNYLLED